MADGTATFSLEVVSPERVERDEMVRGLELTAQDGRLGILANHAPLVSAVIPCEAVVTKESGEKEFLALGEGFVAVHDNRVRLMVDSVERPGEIDVERAEKAAKRARERIAAHPSDMDMLKAEAALRRALMRLRTVKRI